MKGQGMTVEELIAALEAAEGPDSELDAEIARVAWGADVYWKITNWTMNTAPVVHWKAPHSYAGMREPCPTYTASIDAALTLVPEDACWTISVPHQPDMSGKPYWASLRSNHPGARGISPAIALCIAALRARIATA